MVRLERNTLNRCTSLDGWARSVAVGVELLMGISAIFGAYHLLNDTQAFGAKTAWLSGMVTAASAAWRRSRRAAPGGALLSILPAKTW